MTNVPKNNGSGEIISPALRQPSEFLGGAAAGDKRISVDRTPPAKAPSKISSLATGLKNACSTVAVGSCKQTVWISFFFDGTGNNLDADVDMLKHSNVAKLYRAHKGDENNGGVEPKVKGAPNGIYRVYIPGIGTYFPHPTVGDNGGTKPGLGAGAYGVERMEFALEVFDKKLKIHFALANNPANAIIEIDVAVFGFSRGAALARAFVHDFVKDRCKQLSEDKWVLKAGGYPIRIRFLGLFDTVASVGMAMSGNNMEKWDALTGSAKTHIEQRLKVHKTTRPTFLAFAPNGKAGADPAPGNYDGHADWGKKMQIPEMVEEVHHFMAGHEYRNSFPVDSVSVIGKNGAIRRPEKFHEYVYPGVHSDIGGSYRPGEGGKNEKVNTKLGLMTLRDMYSFAMTSKLPFLPETAWSKQTVDDFSMNNCVIDDYRYYSSKLVISQLTLGGVFNAHMRLYYRWRFQSIAKKRSGDDSERKRILASNVKFNEENKSLTAEMKSLENNLLSANAHVALYEMQLEQFEYKNQLDPQPNAAQHVESFKQKIRAAQLEELQAKPPFLKARAKLQALPQTTDLPEVTALYDTQLMLDAQAIYEILANPRLASHRRGFVTDRNSLRPHYKIFIEAYEDEFIRGRGLRDKRIIAFFDDYVHDSLSGFGGDGTMPSDPRVIYLGGDNKFEYAMIEEDSTRPAAHV